MSWQAAKQDMAFGLDLWSKWALKRFPEEENMSDTVEITVKVNGNEVPLSTISDETIRKVKEQEKRDIEGPVFALNCHDSGKANRLWMKLTPRLRRSLEYFLRQKDNTYLSFCDDGDWGQSRQNWEVAKGAYGEKQTKPLFE